MCEQVCETQECNVRVLLEALIGRLENPVFTLRNDDIVELLNEAINQYEHEVKWQDDYNNGQRDENYRQREMLSAYRTVLGDMIRYGVRWE